MTVDALDWTKFADRNEIPEWISGAYSDSYQGPHEDAADTGSAAESIPTPSVTPSLLKSHYRLGSHRPAGESRVAVYPPDDPGGGCHAGAMPVACRPAPSDRAGSQRSRRPPGTLDMR